MTQKIDALNQLLADYQVLYQKARNYHWNITGRKFFELHMKFEELYLAFAEHVDTLAERVLALGGKPVSTLKSQLDLARLKEDEQGSTQDADSMVNRLVKDLTFINEDLRKISSIAAGEGDQGTANLLDGMADTQEKTTWMLRAYLA